MALAMTSSSFPQPPPHSHRRLRSSHPATPIPNAKSKPRAKALPLLSEVGVAIYFIFDFGFEHLKRIPVELNIVSQYSSFSYFCL
jgi:hypothetical protein